MVIIVKRVNKIRFKVGYVLELSGTDCKIVL